ncbi:MAG: ribonuclease HII [Hyphomicrobiales bacterium]|nr:MAG: ribonuclease HII [Hyphomicrobiales bacterium]
MQKIIPNFTIDFSFEQGLWQEDLCFVAGVDEAGRGPWAGPVVAAAAIFKPHYKADFLSGLNDSKKLSAKKREALYIYILEHCDYAVGMASVEEIDEINILQASMLAMSRAINDLPNKAQYVLIDGNKIPDQLNIPAEAIIKGDGRSYSIAAASIVAKVTRDRLMQKLHDEFPHYGWSRNAGYGTKLHQEGLSKHGVTQHHRRSFKPIQKIILEMKQNY